MNPYHRAVRAALAGMGLEQADLRVLGGNGLRLVHLVAADRGIFGAASAAEEERDCIAEIDVYGHGAVQAADRLFLSTETVKRRRRTGYVVSESPDFSSAFFTSSCVALPLLPVRFSWALAMSS